MASNERSQTTKGVLQKLGILAIGAILTLSACGTTKVLAGTAQTSDLQSALRDSGSPCLSDVTAAPAADGFVFKPGRPY